MKKSALSLVILLFMLLPGCDLASCDTVAKKPVSYRPDGGTGVPEAKIIRMTLRQRGCSGNTCDYWAGLAMDVFNPTAKDISVTIDCTYYVGSGVLGKPYIAKTKIPAKTYRRLEGFDLLFSLPAGYSYDVYPKCIIDFGSSYDKIQLELSK